MNKKILILIPILILIAGGGFWIYKTNKAVVDAEQKQSENTSTNKSASLILYYSDSCPHCVVVKDYMKEHNIDIAKKEVSGNSNNSNELMEKAASCGMAQNSIGVPFLWNEGKCITGDQDIIQFLKQY